MDTPSGEIKRGDTAYIIESSTFDSDNKSPPEESKTPEKIDTVLEENESVSDDDVDEGIY